MLHGDTELQLQQLAERARTVGLAHHLVQDAGHTQVKKSYMRANLLFSITCLSFAVAVLLPSSDHIVQHFRDCWNRHVLQFGI